MIDHIALRVSDREAAAKVLLASGYQIDQEFEIPELGARSYALSGGGVDMFISSGKPGSPVAEWVEKRGNGVHHIAHAVEDIYEERDRWLELGVTFQTEVLECPCVVPMRQVFTTEQNGLVHELIERNGHPGFCKENVRRLMGGTEM